MPVKHITIFINNRRTAQKRKGGVVFFILESMNTSFLARLYTGMSFLFSLFQNERDDIRQFVAWVSGVRQKSARDEYF